MTIIIRERQRESILNNRAKRDRKRGWGVGVGNNLEMGIHNKESVLSESRLLESKLKKKKYEVDTSSSEASGITECEQADFITHGELCR